MIELDKLISQLVNKSVSSLLTLTQVTTFGVLLKTADIDTPTIYELLLSNKAYAAETENSYVDRIYTESIKVLEKEYDPSRKEDFDNAVFEAAMFFRAGLDNYVKELGEKGESKYKKDKERLTNVLLDNIFSENMFFAQDVRKILQDNEVLNYREVIEGNLTKAENYLKEIGGLKDIINGDECSKKIEDYTQFIKTLKTSTMLTIDVMFISRWRYPDEISKKVDFKEARKLYLEALEELGKLQTAIDKQDTGDIIEHLEDYRGKYQNAFKVFRKDIDILLMQAEEEIMSQILGQPWQNIVYRDIKGNYIKTGATKWFKAQWEGIDGTSVYNLLERINKTEQEAGKILNMIRQANWGYGKAEDKERSAELKIKENELPITKEKLVMDLSTPKDALASFISAFKQDDLGLLKKCYTGNIYDRLISNEEEFVEMIKEEKELFKDVSANKGDLVDITELENLGNDVVYIINRKPYKKGFIASAINSEGIYGQENYHYFIFALTRFNGEIVDKLKKLAPNHPISKFGKRSDWVIISYEDETYNRDLSNKDNLDIYLKYIQ